MGSVGSIEKVMVGGILAIILLILAVAINGTQDDPNAGDTWASADEVDGPHQLSRPVDVDENENVNSPDGVGDLITSDDDVTPGPDGGRGVRIDPPDLLDDDSNLRPSPIVVERPRTYTVKGGDTFGRIAVRVLGDLQYVTDLQKSNEDVDANRLQVGHKLNLPLVGKLAVAGGESVVDTLTLAPNTPAPAAATTAGTYKVKKGDTLYGISRERYGSSDHWKKILAANAKVLDAKALRPGMILTIPPL